ncbi:histidine kinase [Marinilongibacter aquaticus]|uniref:sensor histidine kinase n=1 Tax=Marinilongibacter aquaticus TaxID=2975157 RepID=UPI0021BD771C|nr:histidine kinase [Marinilongibacter aquaticus]UBM60554.1 histidine kinase [Marinilongibacter aquaticus]
MQKLRKNGLFYIHVFFWVTYFSFFFYRISFGKIGHESKDWTLGLADAVVQVLVFGLLSYLNYFYFLPQYLKDGKLGKFLFQFLSIFAVSVVLHLYFKKWLYEGAYQHTGEFFFHFTFVLQHTLNSLFVITFISLLRFVQNWADLEAKRKQMENDKLQAELRFLKEQINPHFLFNTLNNLYYLAHTQSPKTKDVVAKLSQMMRYMIYEANHEKVPVSNEIVYIKNYIELEKMRLDDEFRIKMEVEGNYDHLLITPLIFITFLENAFKHGIENGQADAWVHVHFKFENGTCEYTVENSLSPKKDNTKNEGIGLINTKRRLNLSYKNKHELQIEEREETFFVRLQVNLN